MSFRTRMFPFVALALFFASGCALAEDGFVAGTADVPLMAGLVEEAESALVFEVPGGRVIDATAAGPVSEAAVRRFYGKTLPQLGWEPGAGKEGPDQYRREGEGLVLEIAPDGGGGTRVRFRLNPIAD